ncbi:uncharacterized protein G2W53_044451 [Senna tora]|uniref:Uncharacterized protein n=1 Tax=Senna tora TaxID=362788 RepID=A0A834SCW3_9FABA|nr:uncharacterized protein G2W53_044451 [Senna tora]
MKKKETIIKRNIIKDPKASALRKKTRERHRN